MRHTTWFLVRLALVALLLWGAAFPALAQGVEKTAAIAGRQRDRIDPDELDEFFAEKMAELLVPGVTIAFVQDGEILLTKEYGFANVEQQIPVDPETAVFAIGSASKLFLVTAVM